MLWIHTAALSVIFLETVIPHTQPHSAPWQVGLSIAVIGLSAAALTARVAVKWLDLKRSFCHVSNLVLLALTVNALHAGIFTFGHGHLAYVPLYALVLTWPLVVPVTAAMSFPAASAMMLFLLLPAGVLIWRSPTLQLVVCHARFLLILATNVICMLGSVYASCFNARHRFAVYDSARKAAEAAKAHVQLHQRLLTHLLPPHVADSAWMQTRPSSNADQFQDDSERQVFFVEHFGALAITHVQFCFPTTHPRHRSSTAVDAGGSNTVASTATPRGASTASPLMFPARASGSVASANDDASEPSGAKRHSDTEGDAAVVANLTAWQKINSCVSASHGVLRLVSTLGDEIAIAGPFHNRAAADKGGRVTEHKPTREMEFAPTMGSAEDAKYGHDSALELATHKLVDFAQELARSGVAFAAALVVDSAIGTLLGTSCRRYKLFGPAVRRSQLIASASGLPFPAFLEDTEPAARLSAFAHATERFVRCYFPVTKAQMSEAVRAAPASDARREDEEESTHEFGSQSSLRAHDHGAVFGRPASWRVAMVGQVRLHPIKLEPASASSLL